MGMASAGHSLQVVVALNFRDIHERCGSRAQAGRAGLVLVCGREDSPPVWRGGVEDFRTKLIAAAGFGQILCAVLSR